jgi:p24 family protein delta-1
MSDFLQSTHGEQPNVQITVTGTPISDPETHDHKYATKYFAPTVINYVAHSTSQRRHKHRMEEDNLEGYGVCLFNLGDRKQMQVIYDMVLLSEIEQEEVQRHRLEKEEHLTPLENTLEASINAANGVLREMKYMEKREQRMRQTADSINTRVRWFSYFSIAVLLGVTFIQVTYLKRYFKKKKLM